MDSFCEKFPRLVSELSLFELNFEWISTSVRLTNEATRFMLSPSFPTRELHEEDIRSLLGQPKLSYHSTGLGVWLVDPCSYTIEKTAKQKDKCL